MTYPAAIESHFRALRGTPGFILSPEDWRRAEGWQKAGIPLEQALRGLDAAFQAHRAMRKRYETVNGLGWCEKFIRKENQKSEASSYI